MSRRPLAAWRLPRRRNLMLCARGALSALLALLALLAPLAPCAEPLPLEARESALTPARGAWSVGVFNPLRLQVSDDWGLELHPLAALLAPHVEVHHALRRPALTAEPAHALTLLYGLSAAPWALRFALPLGLRGYLGPSCLVTAAEPGRGGCQESGWGVTPKAGARYSYARLGQALTAEADLAAGILLSGERPAPLDAYAPVELMFAPLTRTWRAHLGARAARRVWARLSVAAEVDLFWVGSPEAAFVRVGEGGARSPWTLSAYVGGDVALGAHLSLTAGVMYWNSDQRAAVFERDAGGFSRKVFVRSHDLWPTVDLMWRY